jgi:hypothetical protein
LKTGRTACGLFFYPQAAATVPTTVDNRLQSFTTQHRQISKLSISLSDHRRTLPTISLRISLSAAKTYRNRD